MFKILIQNLTLGEMLLLQGLYATSSPTLMAKIIEEQPNPQLFYKSTLELDMCNIASIYSLDSMMIKAMLHEKHSAQFSKDYPIFYNLRKYENKERKTYMMKSAIDIAL